MAHLNKSPAVLVVVAEDFVVHLVGPQVSTLRRSTAEKVWLGTNELVDFGAPRRWVQEVRAQVLVGVGTAVPSGTVHSVDESLGGRNGEGSIHVKGWEPEEGQKKTCT